LAGTFDQSFGEVESETGIVPNGTFDRYNVPLNVTKSIGHRGASAQHHKL